MFSYPSRTACVNLTVDSAHPTEHVITLFMFLFTQAHRRELDNRAKVETGTETLRYFSTPEHDDPI